MHFEEYDKLRDHLIVDLESHINGERKSRKNHLVTLVTLVAFLGVGVWGIVEQAAKKAVESTVHGESAKKAEEEASRISDAYLRSKQIVNHLENDYSSALKKMADLEADHLSLVSIVSKEIKEDSEFISSLKGKDGVDGENGINGKDGAPGISNLVQKGDNWCADLGNENQICWGYEALSTLNSNSRSFKFAFAKPFSSIPTITNGINSDNTDTDTTWAFSVRNSDISTDAYSGRIIEHSSRNNKTPVRMSYMAIGTK